MYDKDFSALPSGRMQTSVGSCWNNDVLYRMWFSVWPYISDAGVVIGTLCALQEYLCIHDDDHRRSTTAARLWTITIKIHRTS